MFNYLRIFGIVIIGLSIMSGCASEAQKSVAVDTQMLKQEGLQDTYNTQTIVLHNLQRAMDPDLPHIDRMKSLEVVKEINSDGEVIAILEKMSRNDDTPDQMKWEIESYLKNWNEMLVVMNTD